MFRHLAAKKDKFNITRIAIFGKPLSAQFTGYGEDGQLQPENPTGMLQSTQGPVMVHEGEAQIQYPDGQTEIIAANQLNQAALAKIEKKTGMPGMQTGGVFKAARPLGSARPVNVTATEDINIQPDVVQPNTINQQQIVPNKLDPIEPDVIYPKKLPKPQEIKPNILEPIKPMKINPVNLITGQENPPAKPIIGKGVSPVSQTTPIQAQPLGQADIQTKKATTTTPTIPTEPEKKSPEYEQALQRLKKYSEGEDPFSKKIREEERMRLAGEEAAGMGALEQQMSQMGLTGREALTERAMLGRAYGAQEVDFMSNLRKAEADRAFAAATQLPGAVMAGMQYMTQKEQWQKEFDFQNLTNDQKNEQWQKLFDYDKEKFDKTCERLYWSEKLRQAKRNA